VGRVVLALNFRTYFFHPERAPGVTRKVHAFRIREQYALEKAYHTESFRSCMGFSDDGQDQGLSEHLVALSLPCLSYVTVSAVSISKRCTVNIYSNKISNLSCYVRAGVVVFTMGAWARGFGAWRCRSDCPQHFGTSSLPSSRT
jgi:hypothetical protein